MKFHQDGDFEPFTVPSPQNSTSCSKLTMGQYFTAWDEVASMCLALRSVYSIMRVVVSGA